MIFKEKQRFFAIILFVSLVLNFFLGGIMVGKYFSHSPPHSMRPDLLWRMIQNLPEDSQIRIRPLMQKFHFDISKQRHQVRKAFKTVHEQLTATHFNKESLSQALATLRQEIGKTQQQMHIQLLEIASQLNEKERQQLSKIAHRKSFRHHNKPPFLEEHKPSHDNVE